jgi:hypothetical protein
MSHSCIKGEIKKFTNCHILKILRQMWRFQKTKFCASWNIQCRSITSHIHPPKALCIQIFMILHQCHFISAIYLSKQFFLNDHFYSVVLAVRQSYIYKFGRGTYTIGRGTYTFGRGTYTKKSIKIYRKKKIVLAHLVCLIFISHIILGPL